MKTNVISNEKYQSMCEDVLDHVAITLARSLGPSGSNTLVQDKVHSFMTKDGITILSYLKIDESECDSILQLIKKISRKLSRTVGDGSTSSIVVANNFYKELKKNSFTYTPKQILQILNILTTILEKYARKDAIVLDIADPQVEYIATVATNNDVELGQLIAEAYKQVGRYGFVTYEPSPNSKSSFTIKSGFEISGSYTSYQMITDRNKQIVSYENPNVLMVDSKIEDEDMDGIKVLIENICLKKKEPLVIVAKGYSETISTWFNSIVTPQPNTLPVKLLAIDISLADKNRKDIFEDLEIYLEAEPILKSTGKTITANVVTTAKLGKCNSVTTDNKMTVFESTNTNTDAIKSRVESILELIKKHEELESRTSVYSDEELFKLRKRIACLTESRAIIHIGGNTDFEKEVAKFLVEDAVFAIRSALINGYNIGGTLYLPSLVQKYGTEILAEFESEIKAVIPVVKDGDILVFINIVMSSFASCFSTVLTNGYKSQEEASNILIKCVSEHLMYDIINDKYQELSETKVINSIETDIEIIKTVTSIVGLLLTSNQMISYFPETESFGPNEIKARRMILNNVDKIIPSNPDIR